MSDECFARIERLIGPEGLAKLGGSCVVVVGLGAVGSYATEALARAGVGRLRLVDFDEVRSSNINRQLYALRSTVGRAKADLAVQRVLDINPACRVEGLRLFLHVETLDQVLAGGPDLVIDAIDSFAPKALLLAESRRRQVRILSSMGAALRTDPTAVRIGPLEEVHHCPLAARLRKRLRAQSVPLDMPCVYSIEPVGELRRTAIAAEPEPGGEVVSRGRSRRPLGSLPTLTGIFGLTLANTALRILLGDGIIPERTFGFFHERSRHG
jgi:tRNA threonylcarbamoyladenosine dehydratase